MLVYCEISYNYIILSNGIIILTTQWENNGNIYSAHQIVILLTSQINVTMAQSEASLTPAIYL